MKKTKGKETLKVTMVAALAVGVFSMAFIGVNNLAFAAVTGETESFPSVTATVNIPVTDSIVPEDYQTPEFTVHVPENEWFIVSANALSPEDAAQIGASYIWAVFGERIDGKTVEMQYSAWPSHTRAYWHGNVMGDDEIPQFTFTICAVSGKRINITATTQRDISKEVIAEINALNTLNTLEAREKLIALRTQSPDLSPEQIEEYSQLAWDFAQKHFNSTEVVSVNFKSSGSAGFGIDADGNIIASDFQLNFTVIDEAGREAEVGIGFNSKELNRIHTQHNDVVPGYNYERATPGRG